MTPSRLAIYYAPPAGSALDAAAAGWLNRADLAEQTVSARRYGFHATIKAPMRLTDGQSPEDLAVALGRYAAAARPVDMGKLAPRLIDGFLALVPVAQPLALADLAQSVVVAFESFRAPLSPEDLRKRLAAPLTARQMELLDAFGYPYVGEEFRFHMTLTDRLAGDSAQRLLREGEQWFAAPLAAPVQLDRLVLFAEPASGAAFVRLAPDYVFGDMT